MAEHIPDYDEFELRVERDPGGEVWRYRVVASGVDKTRVTANFVPPFSQTELENFVLRVRARRSVRLYQSPAMEDAKNFGEELADALMPGKVGELFATLNDRAQALERGLRIMLYLTDVPELMEIPWEFLYRDHRFLAHSKYTPVVRSLDLPTRIMPRRISAPLRILGVISNPRTLERLKVEEEKARLEEALSSLTSRGIVHLHWLERATAAELHRVISDPVEEHVVHYIGHGGYKSQADSGVLVFEDDERMPAPITGEELCTLLHDERSLRLVVLNSCEGARTSRADPFSGVASSILRCEVPAVVGMQFEITDDAALTFSKHFYTAMVQGHPVDAALATARVAMLAAGHDIEFGTPVLYLRGADTRLFDFEHGDAERPPATGPTPMGICDFVVQIEQRPSKEAGELIGWAVTVENTGETTVHGLTARRDSGAPLADPVDLSPGARTVMRWRAHLADSAEIITVSGTDPDGTRLSEQVVAGLSTSTGTRPSSSGVISPTAGLDGCSGTKTSASRADAPPTARNASLLDLKLRELGNVSRDHRVLLREAITEDEALLALFRCSAPGQARLRVTAVVTSTRLLWAHSTYFRVNVYVGTGERVIDFDSQKGSITFALPGGETFTLAEFPGSGNLVGPPSGIVLGPENVGLTAQDIVAHLLPGSAP